MSDIFEVFLSACTTYLDFLVKEYGFHKLDPVVILPECSVRYIFNGVVLEVIYEYDDYPWIRVSYGSHQRSLDTVMKSRGSNIQIDRKKKQSADEKIATALNGYSQALLSGLAEYLLEQAKA